MPTGDVDDAIRTVLEQRAERLSPTTTVSTAHTELALALPKPRRVGGLAFAIVALVLLAGGVVVWTLARTEPSDVVTNPGIELPHYLPTDITNAPASTVETGEDTELDVSMDVHIEPVPDGFGRALAVVVAPAEGLAASDDPYDAYLASWPVRMARVLEHSPPATVQSHDATIGPLSAADPDLIAVQWKQDGHQVVVAGRGYEGAAVLAAAESVNLPPGGAPSIASVPAELSESYTGSGRALQAIGLPNLRVVLTTRIDLGDRGTPETPLTFKVTDTAAFDPVSIAWTSPSFQPVTVGTSPGIVQTGDLLDSHDVPPGSRPLERTVHWEGPDGVTFSLSNSYLDANELLDLASSVQLVSDERWEQTFASATTNLDGRERIFGEGATPPGVDGDTPPEFRPEPWDIRLPKYYEQSSASTTGKGSLIDPWGIADGGDHVSYVERSRFSRRSRPDDPPVRKIQLWWTIPSQGGRDVTAPSEKATDEELWSGLPVRYLEQHVDGVHFVVACNDEEVTDGQLEAVLHQMVAQFAAAQGRQAPPAPTDPSVRLTPPPDALPKLAPTAELEQQAAETPEQDREWFWREDTDGPIGWALPNRDRNAFPVFGLDDKLFGVYVSGLGVVPRDDYDMPGFDPALATSDLF